MPTITDPITGHPPKLVTGIYIARGDDTLGPYNSAEAAALIRGGYLRANDQAARNGDAAWVPLATFLPPEFPARVQPPPGPPEPAVPVRETHSHRWRRLTAAFAVLLAVPLLVVGGTRWWEGHRAVADQANTLPLAAVTPAPPTPEPSATPAIVSPALPTLSVPVVAKASPVAPSPAPVEPVGPLHGTISLPPSDGGQSAFAGVRVMAYPLAALESALAPATAAASDARERLDPQIDAAAAERSARLTDVQAALQTWRESPPADSMRPSLRFAYTGARAAARTAEDNYHFLVGERTAAAGGEVYLRDLPEPAATAETDVGGSFALNLPADNNSYAVVACVRPTVDGSTVHPRYWFVKLSPSQRSGREPLRLDSNNLSSADDAGSLVHTAD